MATRVLKLHQPTGHPYWSKGEYQIELPNGEIINPSDYNKYAGTSHRVYWNDQGVWMQLCACGSGYGKVDLNTKDYPPILLVQSSQYDKIEFVGKELVMSDRLRQDLINNKII